MRALILNSGHGQRMGQFTAHHHKSMARLTNGETIFHRQLRLLAAAGVNQFVVTTGPFADQLAGEAGRGEFAGLDIRFVANPDYSATNYIYSMHLAAPQLVGHDLLVLHGDLVFGADVVPGLLGDSRGDLAPYHPDLPQPAKDFKVEVREGRLARVSVAAFGPDCYAFQPLYKLSAATAGAWLDQIGALVGQGRVTVYAEEALNQIADRLGIALVSYAGQLLAEVDTAQDLAQVAAEARLADFRAQPVVEGVDQVPAGLARLGVRRPLLVCGASFDALAPRVELGPGVDVTRFSGYSPNPTIEQVAEAVRAFRAGGCDGLVAVGGGSAIDVAKCVKAFAQLGDAPGWLDQALAWNPTPLVAVPTTAGSGSEATHFAVVYSGGAKQSVSHDGLLPDVVCLDARLLASLGDYQRRATALDATCQCVESIWARGATAESRAYAARGLRLLKDHLADYLVGDPAAARAMLRGANWAGRAINLTQTTVPHAMSYQLSAQCGLAHGHAVALALPGVWRFYVRHLGEVGPEAYPDLRAGLALLVEVIGVADDAQAIGWFDDLVAGLGLTRPELPEPLIAQLVAGVNLERLHNSPLVPTPAELADLYRGCR
jgi:alcohol dehydrogenase class IV/choline kinase